MMKVISLQLVILFSYAVALGTSLQALGSTIDQSLDVAPGVYGWSVSERMAQTFTVGVAGKLDKIGVQIYQSNVGALGDLQVDIWPVEAIGKPRIEIDLSKPFASSLILNSEIPYQSEVSVSIVMAYADFSSAGISMKLGEQWAIVPRRTSLSNPSLPPWMIWHGGSSNSPESYDGGGFYLNSGSGWIINKGNFGFQTFVTVPEPISATLLSWFLIFAGALRCRSLK